MPSKLLNLSSRGSSLTSHGGHRQVVSSNIQILNFCSRECGRVVQLPILQFLVGSCKGCPDQSGNLVATKLGAAGWAEEYVLQVLHPQASVREEEGVSLWFKWIGGHSQKNSSFISLRIEGGCVSGNARRTHPSPLPRVDLVCPRLITQEVEHCDKDFIPGGTIGSEGRCCHDAIKNNMEEVVLLDYNDDAEFRTFPTLLTHIALAGLEGRR